jgi:hypothetical protein
VELGCSDAAADDSAGGYLVSVKVKRGDLTSEIVNIKAEIYQSADNHVAAGAGKAVEIDGLHPQISTRKIVHQPNQSIV